VVTVLTLAALAVLYVQAARGVARLSTRWGHPMGVREGFAWPFFLLVVLGCGLAVGCSAVACVLARVVWRGASVVGRRSA
jgi:hypothetical protein